VQAARDVLLITVDTLRADALGFAGSSRARTPTLDLLAAQGTVFTAAHAHNVVTLPSHANILTGRLPFEHGIRDNAGFVLPESIPTAATLFRDAGFATAAVVGAFPLDARFGLDRGFDDYDDHYPEGSRETGFRLVERRGDEVVRRALTWWKEHADERRFLWVHLFDPHAPYEPPEPWASRFRDDPYLGEVAATDAFLAPLIEPLLEDDSTLVVFTSDHGEALGDHGERTHGLFAYESTLRVPLVIRSPGRSPARTKAPARHIDVLPSLLEGAGVPVPEDLPGRTLLGAGLRDQAPVVTYFEALSANLNRGWAPLRGILRDGHKLISLPLPELYDLEADPAEQVNRLEDADRVDREARARARELSALLPEAGPVERDVTTSADAEALRALGYLSGSAARKERYTADDDPKNLIEVDRQIFRFIDLYQRGQLDAATAAAREIVRSQPDMSAGYYQLAQVLLERGDRREALDVLRRAVERGATDGALLRQYGLLLAEAGRPGEAVDLLEPLRGTGDPENLNSLGLALSEAGRQDDARAVLDEVFAHDPRNPTAHQNLALVALRSQDFGAAETQARRALALNPRLPLAWNYLGVALVNLGRVGEALDAWERALEIQPDDFDVLYNVAIVAARAGDVDRARPALRRFIAEAPPRRYGPDLDKARALLSSLEGGQP
jgi:arylsulfatase A-like enzyme/Flp pilus assembly protein TadD